MLQYKFLLSSCIIGEILLNMSYNLWSYWLQQGTCLSIIEVKKITNQNIKSINEICTCFDVMKYLQIVQIMLYDQYTNRYKWLSISIKANTDSSISHFVFHYMLFVIIWCYRLLLVVFFKQSVLQILECWKNLIVLFIIYIFNHLYDLEFSLACLGYEQWTLLYLHTIIHICICSS